MKHVELLALALLMTASTPALAGDAAVESCVGSDRIEFSQGDAHAFLDEADRVRVNAAMLERYPVLGRDGFAPSDIVIWQRRAGDWVYVTLQANPQQRTERCFTATFSADGFELTAPLLRKYFFGSQRT